MLSDNLRNNMNRVKNKRSQKDELAEKFNEASMYLINQFMKEVASGSIQIDGVTDLMRLFQMYTQVNDLQNGTGSGAGTLPPLAPSQKTQLSDLIPTEKTVVNGEEEEMINLDDLMNLSAEDVSDLMNKREMEVNRTNEAM